VLKALVVGIDYYDNAPSLFGCVNDAYSVKAVLERNSDGTVNFDVKLMTAAGKDQAISRKEFKSAIADLFSDDSEISLLYFSGHGFIDNSGGYLLTSECSDGDDGVSMDDVLLFANESKSRSKIIVFDCCHSGLAGTPNNSSNKALLSEGVTILTASSAEQYSMEEDGKGVFTSLFVDALNGGAANLVGEVTPGSIYAHIDQSLGAWQQRPIFKTNVKTFTTLRKVQPPIELEDLKRLTDLFKHLGEEFMLDPSYEPEEQSACEENTERFAVLQKLNRVNLVAPVGEDHMYFAAINSKSCKLTVLGEHYWKLVKKNRL
jgi:hypothetical protein